MNSPKPWSAAAGGDHPCILDVNGFQIAIMANSRGMREREMADAEDIVAAQNRIAQLEAAITKAKAIDPYSGIGATGAGLAFSDIQSEYAKRYRDAVHEALDSVAETAAKPKPIEDAPDDPPLLF